MELKLQKNLSFQKFLLAVTSSVFLIFKKNHIPDNKIMNGNIVCSKLGAIKHR